MNITLELIAALVTNLGGLILVWTKLTNKVTELETKVDQLNLSVQEQKVNSTVSRTEVHKEVTNLRHDLTVTNQELVKLAAETAAYHKYNNDLLRELMSKFGEFDTRMRVLFEDYDLKRKR